MSQGDENRPVRGRRAGRIMRAGLYAAVISAIVNELVRWVTVTATGAPGGFKPLEPGAPAFWTVALLAVATLLMLALVRYSGNPVRAFWIIAVVALLVSFIPDILLWVNPQAVPGTSGVRVLVLMAMHVIAFLVAVPWLTRAARE